MRTLTHHETSRAVVTALLCGLLALAIGSVLAGPILHLRQDKPGSTFTLTFEGDAQRYYEIWSADSLRTPVSWRLSGMVLGRDGDQAWTDDTAVGMMERYYRIVHRSLTEPNDADGDGIDDVYELAHAAAGLDPLSANPASVEVVTVASTALAAGAVDTPPHQTTVGLRVSPPGSWPVAVWLEGGDGHGTGTAEHFAGGTYTRSGAAKISGDGHTFVAGGDAPSGQAIVITTDGEGRAELVLTSSNEIAEQCRVHARVGTATVPGGSQARSPIIVFEEGEMQVAFPGTLVPGTAVSAVVRRTYKGQPLAGHDIVFFVRSVVAAGRSRVVDPADPQGLDAYAAFDPAQVRAITGPDGRAVAAVSIRDAGGLEYVEVRAEDLQLFGE